MTKLEDVVGTDEVLCEWDVVEIEIEVEVEVMDELLVPVLFSNLIV